MCCSNFNSTDCIIFGLLPNSRSSTHKTTTSSILMYFHPIICSSHVFKNRAYFLYLLACLKHFSTLQKSQMNSLLKCASYIDLQLYGTCKGDCSAGHKWEKHPPACTQPGGEALRGWDLHRVCWTQGHGGRVSEQMRRHGEQIEHGSQDLG